jgi:cysteinyl-tRNA synthetase
LAFLTRFDSIFDILRPASAQAGLSDSEVDSLISERTQAKKTRNFARADEVRTLLLEKGIILEDTREGVRWKRK